MSPEHVIELVRRIEAKDLSTAAHTWRVVLYFRAMGEEFGVPKAHLAMLTHAAALHDVGKLEIPASILQKPSRLTPEEFEIIKIHPVSGYARLLEMGVEDEPILDLVRYHHERWDGQGYPYNLAGDDIPTAARFFAVIDSFDAMTSYRPYREDVGEAAAARAVEELARGAGTRYDPEGVEMFTHLYESGALDYILHHFNDTVPLPDFHADRVDRVRSDAQDR